MARYGACQALAKNPEIADLVALLQATVLLRSDQAERAAGIARAALNELRRRGRQRYQDLVWAALGEWVLGEALLAAGRDDEARTHLERAWAVAPDTWFGRAAHESMS